MLNAKKKKTEIKKDHVNQKGRLFNYSSIENSRVRSKHWQCPSQPVQKRAIKSLQPRWQAYPCWVRGREVVGSRPRWLTPGSLTPQTLIPGLQATF